MDHNLYNSADMAYTEVLRNLLAAGEEVPAAKHSVKSKEGQDRSSREIRNYTFRLTGPLARITANKNSRFSSVEAVARFVWMMGANDRLADIAFYSQSASNFSDDGILVPGSSYGHRIFAASPGVDQFAGILDTLQRDVLSRRAAISVYQAEDAVRANSCDIPCTLGLVFHVRDSQLHATVSMRSNNAFLLLPFNLFEFSLLSEVVASELELPLGSIFYQVASMHVYAHDYSAAGLAANGSPGVFSTMPVMPVKSLQWVKSLVRLEAKLRTTGTDVASIRKLLNEARNDMPSYWAQFFYILALKTASVRNLHEVVDTLVDLIEEPLLASIPSSLLHPPVVDGPNDNYDLFSDLRIEPKDLSIGYGKLMEEIDQICLARSRDWATRGLMPLTFEEQLLLRKSIQPTALVAAMDIKSILKEVASQLDKLRS